MLPSSRWEETGSRSGEGSDLSHRLAELRNQLQNSALYRPGHGKRREHERHERHDRERERRRPERHSDRREFDRHGGNGASRVHGSRRHRSRRSESHREGRHRRRKPAFTLQEISDMARGDATSSGRHSRRDAWRWDSSWADKKTNSVHTVEDNNLPALQRHARWNRSQRHFRASRSRSRRYPKQDDETEEREEFRNKDDRNRGYGYGYGRGQESQLPPPQPEAALDHQEELDQEELDQEEQELEEEDQEEEEEYEEDELADDLRSDGPEHHREERRLLQERLKQAQQELEHFRQQELQETGQVEVIGSGQSMSPRTPMEEIPDFSLDEDDEADAEGEDEVEGSLVDEGDEVAHVDPYELADSDDGELFAALERAAKEQEAGGDAKDAEVFEAPTAEGTERAAPDLGLLREKLAEVKPKILAALGPKTEAQDVPKAPEQPVDAPKPATTPAVVSQAPAPKEVARPHSQSAPHVQNQTTKRPVAKPAELQPRTSFRLLLSQLSDMGSRSQYIKSATLTTSPKTPPAPYNVDAVRKRKNIWTVPTAGVLDFVLNISDFLLKDEGENERLYSAVVERMFLKRKRRLLSRKRALVVLQKVSSLRGPIFDAFITALLHYFHLSRDQVMAIYMNQGDKAKETLLRMLPTLMSPYALMHAARNTDSIQEMLDFEKVAAEHMALNLENPTGHYALRLESLPARVVAQHLLLLNRWQLHLWRKANLVDVSMDGKGKCLRNTLLDGKFLGWADIDWRLPASGQLTFDFVALYRPPADASPVASDAWGQVLAALADLLAPKIREGNQEDPSVRRQVAKVQWAMRAISSRVWLLTRQLRNLLCIFLNRQDRGEVMSTFFLRCVDWPINGKCCQPKFTRHHWKDLSQRLGYMNLFPYGQPEMSFHIIDLEQWEQRRCFHNLVRLANWEDSVNIKNPMMDKDANPNAPAFQPFVAGIPNSWAELENIPTQGLVQCTYTCSVDRQNLKARRRLAASVGGWTNLPDTTFDFWSCLEDVPVEVLKVVTFMIRTWKSTDAAFSALNTQPDNMLNHKEFVDGLTKAGCCKPKRRRVPAFLPQSTSTTSSARLMPSPRSEDEEDATQLETLSSVFRYLDTSHDGDISRKEFETLERVWRELHQSIYELKRDLEVFYGSLQQAFEAIDLDESSAISFEEFKKCVQATHFDGPVQEIFMFIDLNMDQEIDGHEFFELEHHSVAPPLPDYTDGKLAKLQRLFR